MNLVKRTMVTPPGVRLGPLGLIPTGTARNFVVAVGDAHFFGFVVRTEANVIGYLDRCPHAGLPLARHLDAYLTDDRSAIYCFWHGAIFDIRSGDCIGGPCPGARLTPWPVRVENGYLMTT